jgi:hypothetical protein
LRFSSSTPVPHHFMSFPILSRGGALRKSHNEIPCPPTAPVLRLWSITYSLALCAIGDGLDRSSG